jgi:hypothetical protein
MFLLTIKKEELPLPHSFLSVLSPLNPDFLVALQNISLQTWVKLEQSSVWKTGMFFLNNLKPKNKLVPVCLVCILEESPERTFFCT